MQGLHLWQRPPSSISMSEVNLYVHMQIQSGTKELYKAHCHTLLLLSPQKHHSFPKDAFIHTLQQPKLRSGQFGAMGWITSTVLPGSFNWVYKVKKVIMKLLAGFSVSCSSAASPWIELGVSEGLAVHSILHPHWPKLYNGVKLFLHVIPFRWAPIPSGILYK
jgi:hypothetical protein